MTSLRIGFLAWCVAGWHGNAHMGIDELNNYFYFQYFQHANGSLEPVGHGGMVV